MATTTGRVTRSRAIIEAAVNGREKNQEINCVQVEGNKLGAKKQVKPNGKTGKANKIAAKHQGKSCPENEIGLVKSELIGPETEPLNPINSIASSSIKKENENEVTSQYFVNEEQISEIKPDSKVLAKRKHLKVEYEVQKVKACSSDEKILGSSPYFDSGDGTSKQTVKSDELDVKKVKWEPPNWEEVVENIREMRKERNAPVDEMGCNVWMDEEQAPEVRRFQSLVSLMLSSQTKDAANHAAMSRLREHGLTLANVLRTEEETLARLIFPIPFWKTKARHLKRTAQQLAERFAGDIPDTVPGLLSLPGVGPKMAHICMDVAWGKLTGIGVDTHVHRIANRLGWARARHPKGTRVALEAWLPPAMWSELNTLLVGFGQQTCRALRPSCSRCLNARLCPAAERMDGEHEIEPSADVFDGSKSKRTHVQVEVESNEKYVNKSSRSNSQGPEPGEDTLEPAQVSGPPKWTEVLENLRAEHVREARGKSLCNLCVDGFVSPVVLRYQALVSQMLKKATEDPSVDSAMQRLRKHGLTVANIAGTDEKVVSKLIYPLAGWKSKAQYISLATQLLVSQHGGDLPTTLNQLMALPGVEPKTALVCLTFAREPASVLQPEGLTVARRVGWVSAAAAADCAAAERELDRWLPAPLREETLHLLNELGRGTCRATPACAKCANRPLCPYVRDNPPVPRLPRTDIAQVLAEFGL